MVEKKDSFEDDDVRSTGSSNLMRNNGDMRAPLLARATEPPSAPPLLRANHPTNDLQDKPIHLNGPSLTPPPPYETAVGSNKVGRDDDAGDEASRQLQQQQQPPQDQQHERIKCGAGIASGVAGLFLGGPFFGLLLGLGTAYAADQPGPAGDVARTVGEVALTSKAKFQELDDRHRFVEQGKDAAAQVVAKLQEADQRHRFVDRAKEWSSRAYRSTVDFVREHRLIERGMEAVGRAAYWAARKITDTVQAPPKVGAGPATAAVGSPQYRAVTASDKD